MTCHIIFLVILDFRYSPSGGTINDDDRKLFAGGLAQEATEKDLKEYFSKFGEVASVTLKMDQMTGRSRWAFTLMYYISEHLKSWKLGHNNWLYFQMDTNLKLPYLTLYTQSPLTLPWAFTGPLIPSGTKYIG